MTSYCTVCGIKLVAKNRVSYRPNSCHDCELERKRLYTKKNRADQAKRKDSSRPPSKIKLAVKKPKVNLPSKKKKVEKVKSKAIFKDKKLRQDKVKVQAEKLKKERERKKLLAIKQKEQAARQREHEKLLKLKEKEKLLKQRESEKLKREREHEKSRKAKEKEREKLRKEKEREKLRREKEREKLRKDKEKEREKLRKDKEKEREKLLKQREDEKKAKEELKKEKARKEAMSPDIIKEVPEYILNTAVSKVTQRRRLAAKQLEKQFFQLSDTKPIIDEITERLNAAPFNPTLDTGEVLRAPSETPWESTNFRIVNGAFVNHNIDDTPESKGPSEEEVKQIIERIRQEHKTRKE